LESGILLDEAAMEDATRKVMNRLNPNFQKFHAPVSALSGGQRQAVRSPARCISTPARPARRVRSLRSC
jgi:ABC-type sugar transport system ATPase subunit